MLSDAATLANAEVVIIGGGLAGTAAAIELARAGRDVVLVERNATPAHKVCGEFLSGEALHDLAALGVDVDALGAVPMDRVCVAAAGRGYTFRLPFDARSLTRKRLDAELLLAADRAGVKLLLGEAMEQHSRSGERWSVQLRSGRTLEAETLMLATGKHDTPGHPRPAGKQGRLIAFKMYFRLAPAQESALRGFADLFFYRGGYGGLQMVEDNVVNLCALIEKERYAELGGRWSLYLEAMQRECPFLATRLSGATPLLEKPLALSGIPYGYTRTQTQGEWFLGDQAAVIPSFTGDGMSIALHSGRFAAQMYLKGATAAAFQATLHKRLRSQMRLAVWLAEGMMHRPTRAFFEFAAKVSPRALEQMARYTRLAYDTVSL